MISPFAWLDAELQSLEAEGMLRRLRVSDSAPGPVIDLDGKQVVQLASNNYLGLATHPAVIQAASKALKEFGSGSAASRLISGTQRVHIELERALAAFKGAEAALVYATGSMANQGLLPAIAGPGDLLLLDKLCHATLYDGAKLSGAELQRFPHQDINRLAELCKGSQRKVIVVEGVYSMDGDIAPLPEILALAEAHQAIVVVDEAHSTGVLGPTGKGILEHYGLAWHPNLIITGTLSKALGSLGGFVAGPKKLVDWLVNSSRAFIFATALPASCAAAALQSLKLISAEPERLHRLRQRSAQMTEGLREAGWDIGATQTPIIPVTVGTAAAAVGLQERLWDAGFFAPAIRPPTVPAGSCRLRLSVSSEHSEKHLGSFLDAIGKP